MKKTPTTIGALGDKSPAKKRSTAAAKRALAKPRKSAASADWATETFKRIEALRKALDGKQLA